MIRSRRAWVPGEAGLERDVRKAVAELGNDPIDFCIRVGF